MNLGFNTLRTRAVRLPAERAANGKKKTPVPNVSRPTKKKPVPEKTAGGFTLVELLVVVAILAVLSTVTMVGANRFIASAKAVREVNAARQLTAIYLGTASDRNGILLPGIDPNSTATDREGRTWPGYVAKRYPARLAEALDFNFAGTVCVNESEKWADDFYTATVSPAFGINATFVGGSFNETEPDPTRDAEQYGNFCITRLSQADDPARQLVFTSARSHSGYGKPVPGNFYIRSPYLNGRRWSRDFDESESSLQWGNVDPRHNGKATGAFLDGSVRLLTLEQLQDMRIWAKGARQANDPTWSIAATN